VLHTHWAPPPQRVLGPCSGAASDGFSLSHKIWLCALAALLGLARPAAANDSAASLGAGGLTLERAADVAMAVEQLEIRRDLVRVRYVFVNRGPAEISTIVAFPLPDVGPDYLDDADGLRADPVNFVGFTVTVDGRRVTPRAELRLRRREVTGLLRALHVPVCSTRPPPALGGQPGGARPADAARALAAAPGVAHAGAFRAALPAGPARRGRARYRPIAGRHALAGASCAARTPRRSARLSRSAARACGSIPEPVWVAMSTTSSPPCATGPARSAISS
jgi:hypothetical protein